MIETRRQAGGWWPARRAVAGLFFLAATHGAPVLAEAPATPAWRTGVHSLAVDGVERTFVLEAPESLKPGAALVLVYHGYSDSAEGIRRAAGFAEIARREGFVVAYPQGTLDSGGRAFHQVGYAFHGDRKVDDVRFARAIVQRLVRDLRIDRRSVFATGMSNGGDMSFYLASQPRPFVRAIAPVAGCMMASWSSRFSRRPRIPVMAINGTDDRTTLWAGDMANRDGWGAYPGTEAVMRLCVEALGLEREDVSDIGPRPGGAGRVRLHRWWTAADDTEALLYEMQGGGHEWPANVGTSGRSTAEEIWRFFRRYRPGETAGRDAVTYRNPIIEGVVAADPTVIRHRGVYYLYPTMDNTGYDVFVSRDLVHWDRKGKCFTDRRGGVWAPDVFYDGRGDRRFHLYYTADDGRGGKVVGAAISASPLGPFVDPVDLIGGAIDAHMFRDDDGRYYLYYAANMGGPCVAVQPMKGAREKLGDPVVCVRPTAPWEHADGEVAEAPWMLKRKGVYYLMYSGSGAMGRWYGVGYATSRSPLGPWTKYAGNPIAHQGDGIFGPGHHCVVEGPDGQPWMVYHQKRTGAFDWDRFVAIDRIWFDSQGAIHARLTRGADEPAPLAGRRARDDRAGGSDAQGPSAGPPQGQSPGSGRGGEGWALRSSGGPP